MTKEELINKFPEPLYGYELSKDKVIELVELCMNSKAVNNVEIILYNFINDNVPHINFMIREYERETGVLTKDDIDSNLKFDQYMAWYYGFSDYNKCMYDTYSDYLNDKHVNAPEYCVSDWTKEVIEYYKEHHNSIHTLYDACKIAADMLYKDVFHEEYQSMRTSCHNDQTLMCQVVGSYIKQKYMSEVSVSQKKLFYKETMKCLMFPRYFGYNKHIYSYKIFRNVKCPRKIKKFLHNPNNNNISGRNRFNKFMNCKNNKFDRRLTSDYGPQNDLYYIFKNSGISEQIASKICPWKEYVAINIDDMSVNVNGKYY